MESWARARGRKGAGAKAPPSSGPERPHHYHPPPSKGPRRPLASSSAPLPPARAGATTAQRPMPAGDGGLRVSLDPPLGGGRQQPGGPRLRLLARGGGRAPRPSQPPAPGEKEAKGGKEKRIWFGFQKGAHRWKDAERGRPAEAGERRIETGGPRMGGLGGDPTAEGEEGRRRDEEGRRGKKREKGGNAPGSALPRSRPNCPA